jgi:hypothetical protein
MFHTINIQLPAATDTLSESSPEGMRPVVDCGMVMSREHRSATLGRRPVPSLPEQQAHYNAIRHTQTVLYDIIQYQAPK